MGMSTLKNPTAQIVRNVFMNKYGGGDYRTTKLIDAGFYPLSVQNKVNLVISVAKQIIDGKVDYGRDKERIKNLDKKYGTGYGQLIQDEINSLLNAKSKKW